MRISILTLAFSIFLAIALSACGRGNGTSVAVEELTNGGESLPPVPIPNQFFTANNGQTGFELYRGEGTGLVLVKDINVNTSSDPRNFIALNNDLFFVATDGVVGSELWKVDYSTGTTSLVKDIHSGAASAFDSESYSVLSIVNGVLYFVADDGVHGRELWRSNGTPNGTYLVKDIFPGVNGGLNDNELGVRPAIIGDKFYFSADDGVHGAELWVSDGTAQNTQMVKDISPGGERANISDFAVIDGALYFSADDGTHGNELWKSDGTVSGTRMLKDINTGAAQSSYPAQWIKVDKNILFFADDGTHGTELWKTDGTAAGTSIVKDIYAGTNSSHSQYYSAGIVFGNKLYFVANDGKSGGELWMSDGTETGTAIVKEINPANNNSAYAFESYMDINFVVHGNDFYFVAKDENGIGLWKSNGKNEGTAFVKDVVSGANFSTNHKIAFANNKLYFTTTEFGKGSSLWVSDGTADQTLELKTFNGRDNNPPANFAIAGNEVYFSVYDDPTREHQLWKTNGEAANTLLVKPIRFSYENDGGGTGPLFPMGSRIYFSARDSEHGTELWLSDGTESGTHVAADINTSTTDTSNPGYLTAINGLTFFSARDGTTVDGGNSLWISDGTTVGTIKLASVAPDNGASGLTILGNRIFFSAYDREHGSELWVSDGTPTGTHIVKDINPGAPHGVNSYYGRFIVFGNEVYFSADDGTNGAELWKTDGTEGNTTMVKNINPNSNIGSYPGQGSSYRDASNFVVFGAALYFIANDGTTGAELWTSDGTEQGTNLVKDGLSGSGGLFSNCNTNCIIVAGTHLYFSDQSTYYSGQQMWISDGTSDGTTMVKDLVPSAALTGATFGIQAGDIVYFVGEEAQHGAELWKTDGSVGGTTLVRDVTPGTDSSNLRYFSVRGSTIYFVKNDNTYYSDVEWWKSDGSLEGTSKVTSLVTQGGYVTIYNFYQLDDSKFFAAYTSRADTSIWSTDGTANGTLLLAVAARNIQVAGGKVFYTKNTYLSDYVNHQDMYVSDGTLDGTSLILSYANTDTDYYNFEFQGVADDKAYFIKRSGRSQERELWVSDGTSKGTRLAFKFKSGIDAGIDHMW